MNAINIIGSLFIACLKIAFFVVFILPMLPSICMLSIVLILPIYLIGSMFFVKKETTN